MFASSIAVAISSREFEASGAIRFSSIPKRLTKYLASTVAGLSKC